MGIFKFIRRRFMNLIGRKQNSYNNIVNLPLKIRQIAQLIQETYKPNRKHSLNNYRLIDENKNNTLWNHVHYGTIMAICGTNSFGDHITNIKRLIGDSSAINNRIQNTQELYKNHKNISTISGHSLGGAVANQLSSLYGITGVLFNPAITKISNNCEVYRTLLDPVSILVKNESRCQSYNGNKLNSHSISNFT